MGQSWGCVRVGVQLHSWSELVVHVALHLSTCGLQGPAEQLLRPLRFFTLLVIRGGMPEMQERVYAGVGVSITVTPTSTVGMGNAVKMPIMRPQTPPTSANFRWPELRQPCGASLLF